MSESMSISVNGQSQVPPGFRFHPTEEELLLYYLRKKVSYEKIDLDVIREVDLNKLEPWDIEEKCKIGTSPQNEWYFFSHKDKKYPTGTRTNRATAAGFWKATGRDKLIFSNGKRIGMRKTLVFYKGRAPHGQKSDWIMHEYRLDDTSTSDTNIVSNVIGDAAQEEGWVVCRIFKKKNHLKDLESPLASSIAGETGRSHLYDCSDEEALEQILHQMGSGCKEESFEASNYNNRRFARPLDEGINNGSYRFLKLPSLDSPKSSSMESHQNNNNDYFDNGYHPIIPEEIAIGNEGSLTSHKVNNGDLPNINMEASSSMVMGGGLTNWATMDRMVAFQLNGHSDASRQLACFNDLAMGYCTGGESDLQFRSSSEPTHSRVAAYITPAQDYTSDPDLWNFAPPTSSPLSTSEALCHVSNMSV